jgi:hypothetical protein
MQFEQQATAIRYYSTLLIPGMLQTAEYAAAILRLHITGLSDATIKVRTEVRLDRRRQFLANPHRPEYLAILDESVLYREIGGPVVMSDQLRELRQLMTDTSVLVRILPFAAAVPIALLGPFCILDMGDDQDPVLYREGPRGDEIVRSRREIGEHRDLFERLWPKAYDDAAAYRLIGARLDAMGTAASAR